ncbi:tripartite tricarboxylate transporter substrate binding protein [Xylophilus sp. GW821-FHT01B05]
MIRSKVLSAALAALLCATSGITSAQGANQPRNAGPVAEWPQKPIRIIVSFTAGGLADIMARTIGNLMAQSTGQPVVVENKPGANGNLAADYVAKSPADGYTMCLCSTVIESVSPFLYEKMSFDPQKDLAPVTAAGRIRLHLVVRANLPVSNAKEFVEYAKAQPKPLTFGSVGIGSTPHLLAEMFTGFEALHVPYKGGPPAIQDLAAGHLDFFMDGGVSFPFVREGKLRMLAVSSAQRSPQFPHVPTLGELGYRDLDFDSWFTIYAPGSTPPSLIQRLNHELTAALSDEGLRKRFMEIGVEAQGSSPEQIKAIADRERQAFGRVIKESRIKVD